MEYKHPRLDSPEFAGNLRYKHRRSAYVQRPVLIVDIRQVRAVTTAPVQAEAAKQPITHQEVAKVRSVPARAVAPADTEQTISLEPDIPRKHRRTLPDRRSVLLYGMAAMIFAAGVFVTASGFHTNQQVAAQVKTQQKQTDESVTDNVVPSTTKPSPKTVKNYAVSPSLPRYLDIPTLKIHTRILSEGVTKSGALAVPWNIYDTGWYNASSQPGQNGAMLVDGHSGIGKTHGVFWRLATLKSGDAVTVTRGDGRKFTYTVVKVQIVDVKKVNMASMLVSTDTAKPGLNLITCTGDVIPGTDQLNKRVQVYAVLQ